MFQDDAVASPLMVHMTKKTITVLLGILILDDVTNASHGNVGNLLPSDTVSHPRRKETSTPLV
jgi:hypothetical protein